MIRNTLFSLVAVAMTLGLFGGTTAVLNAQPGASVVAVA